MRKFKITYQSPETDVLTPIEVECEFQDSSEVSALEWAEDYAYSLADKGPYKVVEIEGELIPTNVPAFQLSEGWSHKKYKLVDEVQRLRTYPTDEELKLQKEVIELIKEVL